MQKKQRLCILGATGSIGVSTLDVVARHPDRYEIFALTAHSQVAKLAKQCAQFSPKIVVVGSAEAADELACILKEQHIKGIEILFGPEALCTVASAAECDGVMAAIVGAAGLPASLAAAKAGKKVLLANKEALVMSGQLFIDAIEENGAVLLPIDSEHNAIFQCLPDNYNRQTKVHGIHKILLTASGGPFLHRDVATLDDVTPEQAVAHPNWVMGRKISVDSATMMNKGLEVIEAHWLFATPADQIEVLIHPQSVIHSMVSYTDGSVLAQMGNPDMRIPIAFGLAYPERIASGVAPLDFLKLGSLQFEEPNLQRFPCLKLAYDALRSGKSAAVILNASNEVAVQAFLDKRIGFRMINQIIQRTLDKVAVTDTADLEAIIGCDLEARRVAEAMISS